MTSRALEKDKAFPFRVKRSNPRVRLFCLPFAGGSAFLYRKWSELLPADVDVCPIELPGRGIRFNEPLITDLEALKECLRVSMDPLLDVPIALFGHSMGAWLAFELAMSLGPRVVHLFVSGAPTPTWKMPDRTAHLSADEFKQKLTKMGGTPREVLANDELMDLMLPVMRADFGLVENYRCAPNTSVNAPLTVFAGQKDDVFPLTEAERWREFTTGPFRMIEVDQGHFFLEPERERIIREIVRDLEAIDSPVVSGRSGPQEDVA
jgi:medium-chain acyl-[acyl-carrier-protein] hydrolase